MINNGFPNFKPNNCPEKIAIVGSGLTGLASALWLQKAGFSTTLLESEESIGGLSGVFGDPRFGQLPKFHTFIESDDAVILEFLEATGCKELFSPSSDSSIMFGQQSLASSTSSKHHVYFQAIADALKNISSWNLLEEHLAIEWLEALVPNSYIHEYCIPRLRGRFGSRWEDVSAAWLWSEFAHVKPRTDKVRLWPSVGWPYVISRLQARLSELGVDIRTGETVTRLERTSKRTWLVTSDHGSLEAGTVVVTAPIPVLVNLAAHELDSNLLEKMSRVPYVGNRCVVVAVNADISKSWRVVSDDPVAASFIGVIQWRRAGTSLLFMSRYLSRDDPQYLEPDAAYINRALRWLESHTHNHIDIEGHSTWRHPHSQHVFTKKYSECIPAHQLHPDGLWCATMAQTYPNQRSKSTAVGLGKAVAEKVIAAAETQKS